MKSPRKERWLFNQCLRVAELIRQSKMREFVCLTFQRFLPQYRPMKPSSLLRRCALATALGCFAPSAVFAQDTTPPYVAKPISDFTVSAGSAPTVINLKKTFGLTGVTGDQIVRFSTTLGNMDVVLDATDYPLNVANFLSYTNSGAYNNTFIHRSVASFIFQGGGYHVTADKNYPHITENGTVTGEHKGANVRGTIAFALKGGAGSADTGTSEWFFNLADNASLDDGSGSQGPFTAFGHVIEDGLATMDAIGATKTYNASSVVVSDDKGVFTDLPLINYDSSQGVEIDPDLVYVTQVAIVPLTPKATGDAAVLTLKANNSNPGLVTATFKGRKMTLTYAAGKTGSANIVVVAKDAAGTKAKAKFTVTVQ